MTNDLTPATHVRMTVPKFFAVIAGVVGLVGGGLGLFYGVKSSISDISNAFAAHAANREIHIDPGYQFDHGRPVGKHDVDAVQAQTDVRLKDLATAIDQLRIAIVNRQPPRMGPR